MVLPPDIPQELDRAPELNAMLRSAIVYAMRFKVLVSVETPYARYQIEPSGAWSAWMK